MINLLLLLLLEFLCFVCSCTASMVHTTEKRKKCEWIYKRTKISHYNFFCLSVGKKKTNRKKFKKFFVCILETEHKIFIRMRKVIKKVMFYCHCHYFCFCSFSLYISPDQYRSHLFIFFKWLLFLFYYCGDLIFSYLVLFST